MCGKEQNFSKLLNKCFRFRSLRSNLTTVIRRISHALTVTIKHLAFVKFKLKQFTCVEFLKYLLMRNYSKWFDESGSSEIHSDFLLGISLHGFSN